VFRFFSKAIHFDLCFGAELFIFMSTRTKLILLGILLVGALGLVAYVGQRSDVVVPVSQGTSQVVETTTAKSSSVATPSTDDHNVTFAPVSGELLIDAMYRLASTSDFSFSGRTYAGLGFFVDSINEKKNADGMYWILYVNDAVATKGVSELRARDTERYEWKYEKGY